MNSRAFISSYVAFLLLAPGVGVTRIYHNNLTQVDDGEIWGSTLPLFFVQDARIQLTESHSPSLANELLRVKNRLAQLKSSSQVDYYPYAYAFILPTRDTLYADTQLYRWRYGKKSARITNKVGVYLTVYK